MSFSYNYSVKLSLFTNYISIDPQTGLYMNDIASELSACTIFAQKNPKKQANLSLLQQ